MIQLHIYTYIITYFLIFWLFSAIPYYKILNCNPLVHKIRGWCRLVWACSGHFSRGESKKTGLVSPGSPAPGWKFSRLHSQWEGEPLSLPLPRKMSGSGIPSPQLLSAQDIRKLPFPQEPEWRLVGPGQEGCESAWRVGSHMRGKTHTLKNPGQWFPDFGFSQTNTF